MNAVEERDASAGAAADLQRLQQGEATPTVLRGAVRHWPLVTAPERVAQRLVALDNGSPVDAVMTPPEVRGRLHYNATLDGFNFLRNRVTLSGVIEQLQRYARFGRRPEVAVQSAPVAQCLPALCDELRLPGLHQAVSPRIWLGSRIVTPAHFDESHNIACVVAGRRRFTLFPPEQAAHLHVGPLHFAPTGTPISLASPLEPDAPGFPLFARAMQAAQVAELDPGDALYIPPLWWHHVESLDAFNVLVNFWWRGPAAAPLPQDRPDPALQAVWPRLLSLMPPAEQARWQEFLKDRLPG